MSRPLTVNIVDLTGQPIGGIYISPMDQAVWGENRLETTLYEGDIVQIMLDDISEEQLSGGVNIQVSDVDSTVFFQID